MRFIISLLLYVIQKKQIILRCYIYVEYVFQLFCNQGCRFYHHTVFSLH